MFTGLKLRAYEFLGKKEYFRRMALRKQWRTFAMADSDGEAIEVAGFCPTWFSAWIGGGAEYFFRGGGVGGWDKLTYTDSARAYGNLNVTQYKPGHVDAELIPSFVPLAVTDVEVKEDRVVLCSRGIGGGPDLLRMMSSDHMRRVETPLKGGGVSFEVEHPLYRKVVLGIDDTDSSTKGATISTALQIATLLDKALKGVHFLRSIVSLNWPDNPDKTTNNASSALVFAARLGKEEELVRRFVDLARKYTISKDTGVAVMNKVRVPEQLKTYARKVKSVRVDVSEAYKVTEQTGLKLIPITGERGLIGATSAVGLVDNVEEAITPVKKS
jgi:methanogenesis imperfect marker protein 11